MLEGVRIFPVYQFTDELLLHVTRFDECHSFAFVHFPIFKRCCWRVKVRENVDQTASDGLLKDSTEARQLTLSTEYTLSVGNLFPITIRLLRTVVTLL